MVVGLELYLLYFSTSKCVTYFEMSIQSNQKVPADSQFHLSVLFMIRSRETALGERVLLILSLRGKDVSGCITPSWWPFQHGNVQ